MAEQPLNTERIERYLHHQMEAAEQEQFEQELDQNPVLQTEFRTYLEAEALILQTGHENRMAELHQRYFEQKEAKIVRPMRMLPYVAAAAVVLLLVWYFWPQTSYSLDQLYAEYYEQPDFPEVKSSQSSLDSLEQAALLLLKTGEYEKAEVPLKNLLADTSYPNQSQAYLWLGHSHMQRKQFQQAIVAYQKADAHRQTADWYTAMAYLGLEDKERAREQLQQTLQYQYYQERSANLLDLLTP